MVWNQQKSLQFGRFSNGVYFPKGRDAGFFSLCSTSLLDLSQIGSDVHEVKSRRLFRDYSSTSSISSDPWSTFFKQPNTGEFDLPKDRSPFTELHHHSEYREVNLASYSPFVKMYFSPSEQVLDRCAYFIQSYGLDLSTTIAVNIRGTDKHTEVEPPPISTYLGLAEEALSRQPDGRILLVTDQRQYLDVFLGTFKSSVVFFDELPTTLGDFAIHKLLEKSEREDFGINFLATVLLISQSSQVITHTGNGALWTSLFRGGTKGLTQLSGKNVYTSEQ